MTQEYENRSTDTDEPVVGKTRFFAKAAGLFIRRHGEAAKKLLVEGEGGGGGTPGVDYLTPGEPLTQTVGNDGGVGYESPNNVPVLVFRQLGSTYDVIQVWADGAINIGDGHNPAVAYISRNGFAGSDLLRFAANTVIVGYMSSALGFFGADGVTQPAAIANAANVTDVIARLNDLLAAARALGLIAT